MRATGLLLQPLQIRETGNVPQPYSPNPRSDPRTTMATFAQHFDLTNEFNILRIICGLFLLPHLAMKLKDLAGTYELYRAWRLTPPKLWVHACIVIEIVGSIGLVFGIYTAMPPPSSPCSCSSPPGRSGASATASGCGTSAATNIRCSGRSAASSSPCTGDAGAALILRSVRSTRLEGWGGHRSRVYPRSAIFGAQVG